jgi:hypothetical protein
VDLALGELERGYVEVADMLACQPWLDKGPIRVHPLRGGGRGARLGTAVDQRRAFDGRTGT